MEGVWIVKWKCIGTFDSKKMY